MELCSLAMLMSSCSATSSLHLIKQLEAHLVQLWQVLQMAEVEVEVLPEELVVTTDQEEEGVGEVGFLEMGEL